jgi:hypothetical protein
LLGKNDAVIAHEDMKPIDDTSSVLFFYPGHMKWDYAYSIGQQQPDVVAQLWPNSDTGSAVELQILPKDAQPYLDRAYTRITLQGLAFYVRTGSVNIKWDRVAR